MFSIFASDPSTPGYSVFQYSWPGSTWPECECPPRVNTCTMTGADTAVTYTMRHVFGTGSRDIPGLVITVPMPSSGDITTWRVKITWDMQTSDRRIQVTSRTKVRRKQIFFQSRKQYHDYVGHKT